jgi:uncharacterized membrane protein
MTVGKVIATFANADQAEQAVRALHDEGFSDREVSLVAKDHRGMSARGGHNLTTGAAVGAGVGTGTALLATAGALVIPGIGPILALGPLAAALTGAAVGGLAGAFVDWGIPAGESRQLQREVQEGRAVVLVDAQQAEKARGTLSRFATEVKTLE